MESLNLQSLTICLSAIGGLVYFYRRVNFWNQRGIPYIQSLPIVGTNLALNCGRIGLSDFITYIYNKFPDAKYFGIMDFNTPVIVIRDVELIKDIGVKNFENFLNHKRLIDETMDPIFGRNVFSLQGKEWKLMRQILSPSFSATKMKVMFEFMEKCASDFVKYFLDHPDETRSINMYDLFTRYTNDVIAIAAFGISVNSIQNKENEFYMKSSDATSFNGIWRFIKFKMFQIFPKLMRLTGESFLSRSSAKFFKTVIHETLRTREGKKIIRPDMIHFLMEARNKKQGVNVSINDIIAQAFLFCLANSIDPSTSLCFIAHELAINPDIQEKLRNEVDRVMEKGSGKISYDTLLKMKYLNMVVSEALRKYPTTPLTDRVCTKAYTLPKSTPDSKECTLEPNTLVWIPIIGLHHDPEYFPDPEKFDPERFNDENKNNIHHHAYLPFGLGPRKCIGTNFALMEIKVILIHLLQHFIFERAEKTRHPLEYDSNIITSVKGGFWIKLTKRHQRNTE